MTTNVLRIPQNKICFPYKKKYCSKIIGSSFKFSNLMATWQIDRRTQW